MNTMAMKMMQYKRGEFETGAVTIAPLCNRVIQHSVKSLVQPKKTAQDEQFRLFSLHQHNDTKHNDTQRNDTQQNNKK